MSIFFLEFIRLIFSLKDFHEYITVVAMVNIFIFVIIIIFSNILIDIIILTSIILNISNFNIIIFIIFISSNRIINIYSIIIDF